MQFNVILYQICILGILVFIGIICSKRKILPENSRLSIKSLVFYVTLPLLIVTSLSRLELNSEILKNGGLVIIFAYVAIFLQLFVGYVSAKLLKLNNIQANLHIVHTFFGNIVFLGFPLIDALFPGGEALLYAAIYQFVTNTVLWTIGIFLISEGDKRSKLKNMKKLINPNTVALSIGFLIMILRIKLPSIIFDSLGGLGKTTLYLAMIYIGLLLGESKILSVLKRVQTFILSFNKLFLIPVILIFMILGLQELFNFHFPFLPFSVVVLEAATPCGAIMVILAKQYGSDDKLAMENVILSTILSCISLPFIYFILETMVN
ncbi:AEC family transporter [Bacteroidota bacterium]